MLTSFTGHTTIIILVAFSSHGECCIAGSQDTTVCVWNSKTGELLSTFKRDAGTSRFLAFSNNKETSLSLSHENTAYISKRVYGFSSLDDDNKKLAFKRFVTLFPLL